VSRPRAAMPEIRSAFDHAQQLLKKGKRHHLVSRDLLQGLVDEMSDVARQLARAEARGAGRTVARMALQEQLRPASADEWERAAREEALAQATRPDMAGVIRLEDEDDG
jgi:hypothetical protein